MKPQLIIAFGHLTEGGFYAKARHIDAALHFDACAVCFPQPWPASVPSLAEMHEAFLDYQTAYEEARTEDAGKIENRCVKRAVLTRLLVRLVPYLELVAGNDLVMLASTGYDIHASSGSAQPDKIPGEDGTVLPGARVRL